MNKNKGLLNLLLISGIISISGVKIESLAPAKSELENMNVELEKIKEEIKKLKDIKIEEERRELKFNYYNLYEKSGATKEDIDKYLEGTGLEGLGTFYIQAENETGINAVMLMSLNILESGWGDSRIARDKNNISGFMAYNEESYDSAMEFDSKGECILYVAAYLKNNYLEDGGKYFNGYGLEDVNKRYCLLDNGQPDYMWSKKINTIAREFVYEANIEINSEYYVVG